MTKLNRHHPTEQDVVLTTNVATRRDATSKQYTPLTEESIPNPRTAADSADELQRATSTPCSPATDKGEPAPGVANSLVGRRPLPKPPRTSRSVAFALGMILVIVGVMLGIRYGWPRSVEQFVVSKSALNVELSGPGTLDAIRKATISARVQGRLVEINVDRNDIIAQGALIARISSDDLARQRDAAVAAHDAAIRIILQARADKVHNEATLANMQSTFTRKSTLLSRGFGTQSDYDGALAAQSQSEASLVRANAAIETAQAQERSAAANVQVSQAQLDEATIRAPFAGVVTSRDRNLGAFVTPGASIVQLVDPSTIVLTARFDESAIADVQPGQLVRLRFVAEPNRLITARVLRLSRLVDTETREFTVDITPDELPANWAIGQRGTAIITVATHDGLSVPSRNIVRQDGNPGVWVLADGRARWRSVELGPIGGNSVEVSKGLEVGDVVLAPDGVFEWMRVRRVGPT
jgi:HlyD family secretion protein